MRLTALLIGTALLGAPAVAFAQAGVTQSRDGLGDAAHPGKPQAASPAGSENASTGPQAHPAYPSGSSTPNPGAAFVRTQPKPASGTLSKSPGTLSTTRVTPSGSTKLSTPAAADNEGAGKAVR